MTPIPRLLSMIAVAVLGLMPLQVLAAGNELINFKENTKLPSFALPELSTGKEVAFEAASGQPAVVMFFSVSPAFREQRSLRLAEVLAKVSEQFAGRVRCLAVFSDDQGRGTVKKYLDDRLITIPVVDDAKRQVYGRYGVFMMPLVVLLSGDGVLQAVLPYTANIDEILANNLKFLLGEWSREEWQKASQPQPNIERSKEEKEYVRRVNYGRVMLARQMHPAALREFMTAAKVMPQAVEAHIGLGQVHLAMEKLDLAEKAFRQALTVVKDSDEALAGLGLVLYKKGDMAQAIPILENALISENPTLEVIVALADHYEQNGQIDKAIRLNKLAVARLLKSNGVMR